MDEIISKLSSIEESASSIMDQANIVKKELAAKYAAKTANWDHALEAETDAEIAKLRETMKAEIEEKLSSQIQVSQDSTKKMQEIYDKQHNKLVERLFTQMIKE